LVFGPEVVVKGELAERPSFKVDNDAETIAALTRVLGSGFQHDRNKSHSSQTLGLKSRGGSAGDRPSFISLKISPRRLFFRCAYGASKKRN
jgi:hypothetical protein